MVSPGNGHISICVGPDDIGEPPMPELLAYEEETRPEVERRLGPRSRLINPIVGTMFPNFSLLRATSRTFRVWHPRGPDKTEVWSWVFIDKAAPAHVKEARHRHNAGMTAPEQPDATDGRPVPEVRRLVVKVGTSSLVDASGAASRAKLEPGRTVHDSTETRPS